MFPPAHRLPTLLRLARRMHWRWQLAARHAERARMLADLDRLDGR